MTIRFRGYDDKDKGSRVSSSGEMVDEVLADCTGKNIVLNGAEVTRICSGSGNPSALSHITKSTN